MTIGEYQIVRPLGRGGMSEVYEAENPRAGSRHAIKVYSYREDDEAVRARFLVEGKLLARLSHPRIVKVTDLGTDGEGRPYFVMDLILNESGETQSLADVPAGSADEETIARWYDDMREGLAYIHAQGVVHRDLKLQNVLIGPDGHAVLTDFGISRIFKPNEKDETVVDPVQTLVNLSNGQAPVMGSLGYMAPEIEMGVQATPESDWYALGVIVYRLLTGMWCDARTDVLGSLAAFDPVWTRIAPKLLHANPAGRECLSFAAEKEKDRMSAERAAEKELDGVQRDRRRLARILRWSAVLGVVLLLGFQFFLFKGLSLRSEVRTQAARLEYSSVDGLLPLPTEATDEDRSDEGGPSTVADYRRARLDAGILLRDLFARIRSGELDDRMALGAALRDEWRKVVEAHEQYESLFPEDYTCSSVDDGVALADLLKRAWRKLLPEVTE